MEQQTVERYSSQVEKTRRRLARAQTTGKSGEVSVKISGRGAVQVDLGDTSLGKNAQSRLETQVAEAVDQALEKQRRRVEKEINSLT